MKVTTFLIIKAIVSLAFGIAFVLLQVILMGIYGTTLDPAGALMAQFAGAGLIGIGLICWLGRSAGNNAQRAITLSLFICDTVGFIVALVGQLSGLMNQLGWMVVALWLLLALGNGYCRFLKQEAS